MKETGPETVPHPRRYRPGVDRRIQELLERPILSALIHLSWPVFASMLLHTLFNLTDAFWVGRLGPASLAAVTTSIFATWTILGLAGMVATGLVAVVARHAGAAEREQADHAAAQGILISTALAVCLALLSQIAPRLLFSALDTQEEVADQGVVYLQVLLLAALPGFLLIALEAILRAWGNTRTPLKATMFAVGTNLLLDPILILGLGPIPSLGVRGAAIATVLSQTVGLGIVLVHLTRHRDLYGGIPGQMRRPSASVMARLVRIGAPPTLGSILYSTVYLILSRVAAGLGTGPLAILGVGNRLESFSYLTAYGLSAGAATLVGQNLGAGRHDRARRTATVGMRLGLAVTTLIGLSFFFFGEAMFSIFTSDPGVREAGGRYMKILAICQPFMGMEIVLGGAFAGAGYTLIPSWISVGINLARIPLAFWLTLSLGLGLPGLAWIISLTGVVRGVIMLLLNRRGRWLQTTL